MEVEDLIEGFGDTGGTGKRRVRCRPGLKAQGYMTGESWLKPAREPGTPLPLNEVWKHPIYCSNSIRGAEFAAFAQAFGDSRLQPGLWM